MRKLPHNLENPFDNIMMDTSERISPWLRSTGHTPNAITTYSMGSAALALWALTQDRIGAFGVLWMLHAFWDCADGHFARKYGMTSRAGDLYDHIVDNVAMLGLMIIMYRKYAIPIPVYVILFAMAVNTVVHFGCQQKYIKGSGETIDVLQGACGDTSWLHVTRWFSHGTTQLLLVGIVWYLHKNHRRVIHKDHRT